MAIYKHPMSSTTSFSDDDNDDDSHNAIFYAGPHRIPLSVAPAPWASKMCPKPPCSTRASPISKLPAEVLIHILKHLHSSRDLFSALRVSRTWCECSVELLWHKPVFPRYEMLLKMAGCLVFQDQTFTYAKFIRRLNLLALSSSIRDEILFVFKSCDRLERLTLVNCDQVTDRALSIIFPNFPDLVAVDLSGVVLTTDQSIVTLAQTAKSLQGINLSGCSNITDVGVLALARHCPLLRRVKLSGLTTLTDLSISALATLCPLLLELDLNFCGQVTDASIRDIWTHSTYMRELRLSHCSQLTDAAFPAPPRPDGLPQTDISRPFPLHPSEGVIDLHPVVLNRQVEYLRMLDLTSCSLITDNAIEGLISHAPKIRNLVLSKCGLLTDRAIEQVCRLGRHLHYLHLGHVVKITDRSVRLLARSCTRLRYVDFANCLLLTDMSVFELSALPKLRRIGLVRVSNLTDDGIFALGDRHTTLERIHLSYCDQISVMAVHFLLQKLHKLTHLSLTGIPAFRQPELQKFCREPPKGLNSTQQLAFCVYSGKGVTELRQFLSALFDHITEQNGTDDTEYDDDDDDDDDPYNVEDTPYEVDEEETSVPAPLQTGVAHAVAASADFQRSTNSPASHEFIFRRDRPVHSATIPSSGRHANSQISPSANLEGATSRLNAQIFAASGTSRRQASSTPLIMDTLPIIEASNSPPPSDIVSNRSTGTNHSNGAGFFCQYEDGAPLDVSSRQNGALTPDLNFAELGHGLGTTNARAPPMGSRLRSCAGSSSYQRRPLVETDYFSPVHQASSSSADASFQNLSRVQAHVPHTAWPYREPDDSPASTPSVAGGSRDVGVGDERGRSPKRTFRSTLSIAEHYAHSFFFRRSSSRASGSSTRAGNMNGQLPHGR